MTHPRKSTVWRLRNACVSAGRRERCGSEKRTCYERKLALVFPGSILPVASLQFCNVDFDSRGSKACSGWVGDADVNCLNYEKVPLPSTHRSLIHALTQAEDPLSFSFFLKALTRNFIPLNHSQRILWWELLSMSEKANSRWKVWHTFLLEAPVHTHQARVLPVNTWYSKV